MLTFLLSISDESVHSKIKHLYDTYHDDMIRFAKSRLRKNEIPNYEIEAEDAVQNAFVKIAKYINKINFAESERAIKAYIFSIVSNEIINVVSDQSYTDDIDEYADILEDEDFIESIQAKASYDLIVRTIRQMDEKYSTSLMYHYCYDMDVKEIAQMLGLSEKTVYTRLARGKLILRKTMEEVSYSE